MSWFIRAIHLFKSYQRQLRKRLPTPRDQPSPAGWTAARLYMRVHTASSGEAGLAVDLVTEVHFWDALMDDDISPEKSGHPGPITHHSTTLADRIPGVMKTPRTISSRTLETRWRGSATGRALDSRSVGRGFKSYSRQHCVTTLGKLFTPMCLCHQAV